jgi:hypothetical protein
MDDRPTPAPAAAAAPCHLTPVPLSDCPDADVRYLVLDLADLDSVWDAAMTFAQ